METELPPCIAGRFQVEKLWARGGFSRIYLARQLDLDRPVALKILDLDQAAEADLTRFRDEAILTSRLSHPNIVRVLDHGIEPALLWIAYEFIPGRSLQQVVEESPLDWDGALSALRQIAEGLAVAHEQGIWHRDIKPGNVMEIGSGQYKIADFGIAKWIDDEKRRTESGQIIGTPEFMAPEVIRGEPAGAPGDLYALGITFYQLLTGRLPYTGSHVMEVLRQHLDRQAAPPTSIRPELPRLADHIVERLLAKHPEERYASARALLQDLDARAPSGVDPGGEPLDFSGAGIGSSRGPPTRTAGTLSPQARSSTRIVGAAPAVVPRRRTLPVAGFLLAIAALGTVSTAWFPRRKAERAPVASGAPVAAPIAMENSSVAPEPEAPRVFTLPLGRESGRLIFIELVRIEGGSFAMGRVARGKEDRFSEPVHTVTVPSFYLGRTELTNQQYRAIMEKDSPGGEIPAIPVHMMSWQDANAVILELGRKTNLALRLPTEAEWEYACRAGTHTKFFWGDDPSRFDRYGWSIGVNNVQLVGLKQPNPLGLHDMLGNVWEWTADKWYPSYEGAPTDGSARNSPAGSQHVSRGGGWMHGPAECNCEQRMLPQAELSPAPPDHGLRIALSEHALLESRRLAP